MSYGLVRDYPDPPVNITLEDVGEYLQSLIGALRARPSAEHGALGINPFDILARVRYPAALDIAGVPTDVIAIGFDREIGVAWDMYQERHVVGCQVRRADNEAMTQDVVDLGVHTKYSVLDGDFGIGFGDTVTRWYQVRTVSFTGGRTQYSAYSAATSGVTLGAGATNADLLTRILLLARWVQNRHLMDGVITPDKLAVGTIGMLIRVVVPDAATGDVDTVTTLGAFRVIDAWLIKTGADAGVGDTIQVQTAAGLNVTNTMPLPTLNGKVPCETILTANYAFASGATIRVRRVKASAANAACEVYILAQGT